ncbi:phage tail protein [Vagococcus sp. PNs007]|uniref:Phage tail protein n=1 Tax=Vagococcus proximus TaxID=2991417 RepID=A0ABT5X2N8_9ENTE|nr:phage tail spike protein [Vagococcus proximus]MDF0480273.1 phage tail protein [Vagococcus proximus]
MSYPILYKAEASIFNKFAIGVLKDIKDPVIREKRNSVYTFEFEYLVDSNLFKELANDRLVSVNNNGQLNQRFRINRITKPIKGYAKVYCKHIRDDFEGFYMDPEVIVSGSANAALTTWKNAIKNPNEITVTSNVTTTTKTVWTIDKVANPLLALGGVTGSILQRWGGEYEFDNYKVKLWSQRGKHTGALLSYGKNIIDLENDDIMTNLYTSIYPYAVLREEGSDKEELLTIDSLIIDGPYASKYANKITIPVDFSSEEPKDKAALKKLAESYVKKNDVGKPKINVKVTPIDTTSTVDFHHLKNFDNVKLCDTVTVKLVQYGIDFKAKVIGVEYDPVLERVISYEIGEPRGSLGNTIKQLENDVEKSVANSNTALHSANGKNTNFYGPDEPKATKIGDIWYKDIGGGNYEMYRWDGSIWKQIEFDINIEEQLEEVNKNIDEALKEAEQAREEAGFSKDTAEQAIKDALAAKEAADKNGGKLKEFEIDLDKEKNKLTLTQKDVADGKVSIHKLETDSKHSIESISNLEGDITSIEKNINGIQTSVKGKADQTEVTQLKNQFNVTVKDVESNKASITVIKKDINLKVSKDDLMSQINLNPKGVLIQGKNIMLDGNVKMNDAYIKNLTVNTAFIKNIKAIDVDVSRLTSGTVNTGLIKIASKLELTTSNGYLTGTYNFNEENAIEPRSFSGTWKLGWRDLQFTGVTTESKSNYGSYTATTFGQDTMKFRSYLDSSNKTMKSRIDIYAYQGSKFQMKDNINTSKPLSLEIKPSRIIMTIGDNIVARIGNEGNIYASNLIKSTTMECSNISVPEIKSTNIEARTVNSKEYDQYLYLQGGPSMENAFRLRRQNGNKFLGEMKSDWLNTAENGGGGTFQVRLTQGGYLKNNSGTFSESKLTILDHERHIEKFKLSSFKELETTIFQMEEDENHDDVTSYLSKPIIGYTVESLVRAGMESAITYINGEPSAYEVEKLLPYIFEPLKELHIELDRLKQKINEMGI